MRKTVLILAGALALAAHPGARAADDTPGYTSPLADVAAGLPLHIVSTNTGLRPQIAYGYVAVPGVAYTGPYPGMSVGQSIGVNAVGGAIGGALANAMIYAEAKSKARDYFTTIEDAGCALPVAEPMRQAVAAALQATAWGAALQPTVHGIDRGSLEDVLAEDQPRHAFVVSTSLSPDMDVLLTSLTISAHLQDGDGDRRWKRNPRWADRLVVASAGMPVPPKTPADSERMLAEEHARYAASGAAELIARVNAERHGASRDDRQAAVSAVRSNQRRLREAKQARWTPATLARRRAQLWSAGDCAALRTAIDDNARALTGLLAGLYAQTLPHQGEAPPRDLPARAEPAGTGTDPVREIARLPGGTYLSSYDGPMPMLGFIDQVLEADDD